MSLHRLRWRMRGAWQWPAFVVCTLAGGVVLRELPFYEGGPGDLVGTTLLVGFANLALVAVVAPLVGRALRRRRTDLPRTIAADYAGTVLVCALLAALLVGGLLHRPVVAAEEDDRRAGAAAVHDYVLAQAPDFARGLDALDVLRLEDDLYRTCVPGPRVDRPLCLIVSTDQRPAGVRRDPDRSPNSTFRR